MDIIELLQDIVKNDAYYNNANEIELYESAIEYGLIDGDFDILKKVTSEEESEIRTLAQTSGFLHA